MVIGNGNVAIDVARMLVLHPDELAPTDTADHAIEALADSRSRRSSCWVAAARRRRRSPTPSCASWPTWSARASRSTSPTWSSTRPRRSGWRRRPTPTAQRNVEVLRQYAAASPKDASHKIVLQFLRSPVEILGEGDDGAVTGIKVVRNEIRRAEDGRLSAVATGDEEVIDCGLVLRSIGYRGKPVDDVPFDERRGLIRNDGGRVCDRDGDRAHRRVRRRLDQARALRRHRHQQEGRGRHRRQDRRGPRRRRAEHAVDHRPRRDRRLLRRARARVRHLGGLAGDRRPREGQRRASRPPARQARPSRRPLRALAGDHRGLTPAARREARGDAFERAPIAPDH